jgi:hypothetical protein
MDSRIMKGHSSTTTKPRIFAMDLPSSITRIACDTEWVPTKTKYWPRSSSSREPT